MPRPIKLPQHMRILGEAIPALMLLALSGMICLLYLLGVALKYTLWYLVVLPIGYIFVLYFTMVLDIACFLWYGDNSAEVEAFTGSGRDRKGGAPMVD